MARSDGSRAAGVVGAIVFASLLVALWLFVVPRPSGGGGDPLVVYCAHDSVYAQGVLERFERETGIRVEARYDTEATKSLGLVELIAKERDRPRCDVFWNNEQLGTVWLADEGLLVAYKGAGYARRPEAFKDPMGRWTGFAARMRVWIVNTGAMEATPGAVREVMDSHDLSRVAMAKGLYGTTRTHYTVLWDAMGSEAVRALRGDWFARGMVEANGNAMVKELVASGTCQLGMTDTDDYFAAKDAGAPVAMLPVVVTPPPLRGGQGGGETPKQSESSLNDQTLPLPLPEREGGYSIVIPNTVAIVRGTKREGDARRLVEFLLSEGTELELAGSAARQIPLGPVDASKLSEEVRELVEWSANPYPLAGLGQSADECLAWLRGETLGEVR